MSDKYGFSVTWNTPPDMEWGNLKSYDNGTEIWSGMIGIFIKLIN